jgi:hypothetical protein
MSLAEFGGENRGPEFETGTLLADWTTDDDAVVTAADGLSSWGTTPLWDGVFEGLDRLAADADASFADDPDAGRDLVVVSDGTDTESSRTLDRVVEHALELGIPVHVIAFGPASDWADSADTVAVTDLRALADRTGGTYGYVATVEELPALAQAIAGASCGGYTQIEATFEDPAPSGEPVTGRVQLKDEPAIGVPFFFRAP